MTTLKNAIGSLLSAKKKIRHPNTHETLEMALRAILQTTREPLTRDIANEALDHILYSQKS